MMLKDLFARCVRFCLPVVLVCMGVFCGGEVSGQAVFINEIHYDNGGTDDNEGVEIAGPSGTNLNGWSVIRYNGSNGQSYGIKNLSGTIPDEGCGFGAIWFSISGVQNGAPDGFALSDGSNLVQFLSYEGTFTASNGIANGNTSQNIGVKETNSTSSTSSLQLTGSGTTYTDFNWNSPSTNSHDAINNGQSFTCITTTTVDFASATYTQTENGTSIDLCVDITNPDGGNDTDVEVGLISGSATELDNYTTQSVTFTGISPTQKCITINLTDDNETCDSNRDYTFQLQNVAGGNSAAVGSVDETVLTVTDDEQTSGTIAFQGFEGSGWGYTPSTPECINGGDIWSTVTNIGGINPSLGSYFFGIRDLYGDCGGEEFESLSFAPINTSSYSDLVFSFDYNVFEFDPNDDIKYQIFIDNVGQGEVLLVDGSSNFSTNGWQTETIPYTGSSSNVYIKIMVRQNGDGDYAGIDNIKLTGTGCNTCEQPTAQSKFYSNNSPTFPDPTSAAYNLTLDGNGQNRLIVLREGSAVTTDPVDGTSYATGPFGSGTDIGSNEFAVYNGPNHTATITGLTPGTEYFAKMFEYNCLPGSEDYLTSGPPTAAEPDTDVFITPPENPASFDEGCVGPTSMDLSWTAPANGNWDGYMLVAREGATPHSVNGLDPDNQNYSSDWSATPANNFTFGSGSNKSRVLYIGSATSATITNLVANANYTFELYTYVIGTSGWKYSTGTTTNQTITLADVTDLTTTPHANSIDFTWNLDVSCVDEIIIAASDAGGVTSTPTGTGYTVVSNSFINPSNPTMTNGEKVVYSNTVNSATVTGLTTDQEYCFKVFVRKGNVWSDGVDICETPRDITVLEPGDISIVAVNTDTDDGQASPDEVCFVSYKSITPGTSIDFTDNGYEKATAGKWGDTEGVIRITRNPSTSTPTIAAGKVICIEGTGNDSDDFKIYTCGVEDNNWVVSSLNGYSQFNLNSEDQVWIMQNGSWLQNPGDFDDVYTGNVLYGWTATGWEANPGYNSNSGSTLYPNSFCLSTDLNSIGPNSDKVKYTGSLTALNRIEWIQKFNDYLNWTGYSTNTAYFNATPDYRDNCIQITINPIITVAGRWTGNADNDWFNCKNWDNLRLPDETIATTIKNVSNDPVIDGPGAACYDLSIETGGELTLNDPNSELSIYGNLSVEGDLTNTDGTIVFAGDADQNITDSVAAVNTIDLKNLTINKTDGNLTSDENISIAGEGVFTKGLLLPATNVLVTFESGATTSGASNASFVDGKVRKIASSNTDFTFPIGDLRDDTIPWYQPARIFGNTGTTTIDAQYFAVENAHAGAYYDGQSNTPGDNQEVGNCDYWTIDSIAGSRVKLAIKYTNPDTNYCNVIPSPEYIQIYSLNPSFLWDPVGGGDSGEEIVSSGLIGAGGLSRYGDFALGGPSNGGLNVLPINLLSFTAEAKAQQVLTHWITATEKDNDFFTVERSADARVFTPIGTVKGAGTSREKRAYSFADDAPLSGISYYRLRQTDFDGATTLSEIRSVEFLNSGTFSLDMAYRTDAGMQLAFTSIAPYLTVEIFNVFGQRVYGGIVENYGGRATIRPNLSRGVYVVRLSQGSVSDSRKVFW